MVLNYGSIHWTKSSVENVTKAVEQIFLNAKSLFTFSAGALHLSALFHQKASQPVYPVNSTISQSLEIRLYKIILNPSLFSVIFKES